MNAKHATANCSENETPKAEPDPRVYEAHQKASREIMFKWLNGEGLLEKEIAMGKVSPTQNPIIEPLRIKRPNPTNEISDGDNYITIFKTTDLLPVGSSENPGQGELMMVEFSKSPSSQKEVHITKFKK